MVEAGGGQGKESAPASPPQTLPLVSPPGPCHLTNHEEAPEGHKVTTIHKTASYSIFKGVKAMKNEGNTYPVEGKMSPPVFRSF